MTANFSFVTNAAKGNTGKFAAQGVSDTFAKRRFSNTGRPDQAQDRSFDLFAAFDDGDKFQQAVLDFFEAEMLLVQNLFGRF